MTMKSMLVMAKIMLPQFIKAYLGTPKCLRFYEKGCQNKILLNYYFQPFFIFIDLVLIVKPAVGVNTSVKSCMTTSVRKALQFPEGQRTFFEKRGTNSIE